MDVLFQVFDRNVDGRTIKAIWPFYAGRGVCLAENPSDLSWALYGFHPQWSAFASEEEAEALSSRISGGLPPGLASALHSGFRYPPALARMKRDVELRRPGRADILKFVLASLRIHLSAQAEDGFFLRPSCHPNAGGSDDYFWVRRFSPDECELVDEDDFALLDVPTRWFFPDSDAR